MTALCACGFDMPNETAAVMCERECDTADRDARAAARAASRRLQARRDT